MALPVVSINSATGSDTAASGAGPATAVTGTAASVAGTATSVSITDAVNLAGVATDGSAVLYYVDATAGHRNFDNITAISGSSGAWTVTVANGFSTSTGPFSWAIGGKRASLTGGTSLRLINNNGASGDAMPGWVMEMQSGHSESCAGFTVVRNGDTTNGPITIRGASGAATLPLIQFTNNGAAITAGATTILWTFKSFELQNTNASKTASSIYSPSSSQQEIKWLGLKADQATNNFWKHFVFFGNDAGIVADCDLGHTVSTCITHQFNNGIIENNWIHDCGGDGIQDSYNLAHTHIVRGNIIYNCGGKGINQTVAIAAALIYENNTIESCGSDGISIAATSSTLFLCTENNILSDNGGYGLVFTGLSDAGVIGINSQIRGNQTFNNTSGAYKSTTAAYAFNACPWASGDTNLNPTFTAASTGNFAIGTNLRAKAYPLGGTLAVGTYSTSNSYADPGAVQHQDPAGGGGGGGFIIGS